MFNQTWKEEFLKAKQAYLKQDFVTVKKYSAEAKDDLLKDGLVQAEPLFKWIKKEWLDKGISLKVIVCKNGLYYPVVYESEVEETTGYRGRTPIIYKVKRIDASRFFYFLYEYELFRKTKEIYQEIKE